MSSQESVVSTKKKMCSHFQIMFSRFSQFQIMFSRFSACTKITFIYSFPPLCTNVVDKCYSSIFVSNIVNKLFLHKIWWVSVAKSWCRPVHLANRGLLLQNWGAFSMLGTTVKHGLAIVVGLSFKMVEEKVKQCVTGCFFTGTPP